jgi:hypothetical protein
MTPEEWASIYDYAGVVKASSGDLPVTNGIVGRWISVLATKLAKFYAAHSATLNPYLTQAAIAALQALIANLPAILAVNPPGPE